MIGSVKSNLYYLCMTLVLLAGCTDDDGLQSSNHDSFTSVYHVEDMIGLQVDSIRHQESQRIWVEIENVSMETYQDQPGARLYTPGLINGDGRGNIFVFDYGDFLLKRYSFNQGYITSYGSGRGAAPDELMSSMGIEILGDSVVAILDMYGKKVVYYNYDGRLIDTSILDKSYTRFSLDDGGAQYYMGMFPEFLIRSIYQNREYQFPELNPETARQRMQFSGFIQSFDEGVVFSPFTSNIFMVFSTDGSLVYSAETVPHNQKRSINDGDNSRSISINGDYIYIQARNTEAQDSLHTIIDVYNLYGGEYEWSMRLPVRSRLMNVTDSYFYSLQDTSVVVGTYNLNR